MKLHPPKAIVDKNEPFKEALFGREDFAKSLTGLLRNAEESLVIFVHAPWGEGKTTFAEMWRAYLESQKLDVIYFDAYAADYFDDPFVSFSGEILELVDKRLAEATGQPARREFKKTAIEVGKRLAGLAAKIGIRAATMGAVDATHVAELKEIGSEVASSVSEIGAEIIEKKIENYSAEKDSLVAFKKSLAKLAKLFRDEHGFPLTIIVDELDRCRPDFALNLLERIKHLFDVEGVAFVLLVNRDQIESYIRTVYGDVDSRAYLLKFGNLFVDLPNQQRESNMQYERGRKDYCQTLLNHHGFSKKVPGGSFSVGSTGVLVGHFGLTLREIEKVFAIMAIYYGSLPNGHFSDQFLITTLSTLKVKYPPLYQSLSKGIISADQFWKQSGMDSLKTDNYNELNQEWVKDTFDYCLMSDTEFESATKSDNARPGINQMGQWMRMKRKKIIPFLCEQLDRFSFQVQ